MKVIFAVAVLCAAMATPADARPKHPRAVTLAPECGISMPCEGGTYSHFAKRIARVPFGMPLMQYIPQRPKKQGVPVSTYGTDNGPKPSRWCGWWMARQKGIADRRLNLARNWAHLYGSPTGPRPGAVVVWRHHVGELVQHVQGNIWIVRSGNDGNAVRERPRSVADAIAFRA